METLGLYLGVIASLIAIGGVLWGVEKRWHPARRFWGWLYSHTTAYRVQQLEKQVAGVTNLWVLERESKDAQIKALEESQARYAKVMADKAQETEAAQAQSLQTQMESYRKELVQADAAMQWVRNELARLHQSSEQPHDLTTTEELRQQIKALEALVTALVEIDSKRLISAQDPTPEAKLITQAAKAHRERNGFSELPPLPRTS